MDDETKLAHRIAHKRSERGWSLAELSERSAVSRSMLSKIERGEASPTATVLVRIATAFGETLAELLTEPAAPRLARAEDQSTWIDPATGYLRRQVFISASVPLELVEVELPARASVAAPESAYFRRRHVVWVLDGTLVIVEGGQDNVLSVGDRLEFGPPADIVYRNDSQSPCRYLVVLLRQ